MSNRKIFEIRLTDIGEKAWIAAYTNIQALMIYCATTDMALAEFDAEDLIFELPNSNWAEYTITDDNGLKTMSFADWMITNHHTELIAQTNY